MAGRIPPRFVDELLARTDIVDLISSRIPLRRTGKEYAACCPFHDEKTPSFTVSREKQFYHCFGCGAHGTAIGFLMEYDRLGFLDAVEELAHRSGLQVPHEGEGVAGHKGPDSRPLYATMEQAAELYRQQLRRHPRANEAVQYLRSRGLSGEVAATFGIGYAPPGWDFLLRALGGQSEGRERLIQTGLIIEQDGRVYDRFRERIMFPIRDRRGRVIGFGGRMLGDGKPKYLNSPETPLFHKGSELYGLFEALHANREPERLLVVEGYLDVISLAQFGISYAVATLGTATTADHLRRLLPVAAELIFCFDGDRAGRAAAWKALETTLPQVTGREQIRFLFLPEGEDPDSLIRGEAREVFEQRIQRAASLSDFLFEQLQNGVDMSNLDGRARLAALAEPLIQKVPAGVFRDMLTARLAELVGIAAGRLGIGKRPPPPRRSRTSQATTPLRLAIALLVQNPHLAQAAESVANDWRQLTRPGVSLLAELLDFIAAYPDISTGRLLQLWSDRESYQHLDRLADPALLSHIPEDGLEAELIGRLAMLNDEFRSRQTGHLFNRGSPSDWTEEEKALLRRRPRPESQEKT